MDSEPVENNKEVSKIQNLQNLVIQVKPSKKQWTNPMYAICGNVVVGAPSSSYRETKKTPPKYDLCGVLYPANYNNLLKRQNNLNNILDIQQNNNEITVQAINQYY